MKKTLITEHTVYEAIRSGKALQIGEHAIITPSARDLIRDRNIPLQTVADNHPASSGVSQQPKIEKRWSQELFANKKVVAVGADHGGFPVKEMIKEQIIKLGFEVADYGTHSSERVHYPAFAAAVARAVQKGDAWRGIIVDAAGIGSAITANKFKGIRAAMAYDTMTAVNCRAHNDANILTLGGLLLGVNTVNEIVKLFLTTEYEGSRHQDRIDMITAFENENFK